jgi:hypothetical protein
MSSEPKPPERTDWPGRLTTLDAQDDGEYVYLHTTIEERLSMMWELSRAAYSLTGAPFPSYERDQMPGRMIRSTTT